MPFERRLDTRQGGLHNTAQALPSRWRAQAEEHGQQEVLRSGRSVWRAKRYSRPGVCAEGDCGDGKGEVLDASGAAARQPPASQRGPAASGAEVAFASDAATTDIPSDSSGTAASPPLGRVPDVDIGFRSPVYVVWHKHTDLRLHDHEPLMRAHLSKPRLPVVHLHAFDTRWFGATRVGGFPKTGALRARFWIECVGDLRESLRMRGQDVFVRFGCSAEDALRELAACVDIVKVFAYSEVCSEELEQERRFEEVLASVTMGRAALLRSWGYTLHHIEDLEGGVGAEPPEKWLTPYVSFGVFKQRIARLRVRPVGHEWAHAGSGSGRDAAVPLSEPPSVEAPGGLWWGGLPSLQDLGFSAEESAEVCSAEPRAWFQWWGGESHALARLEEFIWGRRGLKQYVGTTDWSVSSKCTASAEQTSKLSPFLAFGCLSPRMVYWEAVRFEKQDRCKGVRGLINSLLWRDFYRFLVHYAWGTRLFHLFGPTSCGSLLGGHRDPTKWCCKHYNNIFGGSDPRLWTWGKDRGKLRRWTDGETGYPFVDAAMLELRATGFMHHLNRETVGWFFVRDLRLDWRLAAEWFESRLVDYDCVLNWGNWAYFILTQLPAREDDRPGGGPRYTLPRYSPYLMATQVLAWGREHDPEARYVKRWLPRLRALPPRLAREPWCISGSVALVEELASLGGAAWPCGACTLENAAARRRCEACGAARPPGASRSEAGSAWHGDLGVYGDVPMVPPPPEDAEYEGYCLGCEAELGWEGDCALCEACRCAWAEGGGPATREAERPAEDPALGWALVPSCALPVAVSLGGGAAWDAAGRETAWASPLSSPVQPGAQAAAQRGKRSARWAVRPAATGRDVLASETARRG